MPSLKAAVISDKEMEKSRSSRKGLVLFSQLLNGWNDSGKMVGETEFRLSCGQRETHADAICLLFVFAPFGNVHNG